MNVDSRAPNLTDVVASAVEPLPHLQAALDREYLGRFHAFLPVCKQAARAGHGTLAAGLAPCRSVINQLEVEASVLLKVSREGEFRIGARLLNLGYMRRLAHEEFMQHRIRIQITQAPFAEPERERKQSQDTGKP